MKDLVKLDEKEFTSKSGKKTFLIDGKIYDESGNVVAE